MRVLYFSRSYTGHDRRFLKALATSPHEIFYLRLHDDAIRYETRPVPDRIHDLAPLGSGKFIQTPEDWIRLVPALERHLQEIQPDIVHAGPIQSCALMTALAGFQPLLAMSWGSDVLVDADRDDFWNWMTRYALGHASMLASDCTQVSERVKALVGFDSTHIVQFPWGVDLETFHPGPDTLDLCQLNGWQHGPILICTRSWEPSYGLRFLLEAFRIARVVEPGLCMVLVGDGSQRPEIEAFVSTHHLESCVLMAGGASPELLPAYFRAADIYVSCAANDGSSISLLEAMATGLPAIVTDRASNREWVGDANGRLAAFGDATAIAAAIVNLAALSTAERRRLGACSRALTEQRANWKVNFKNLLVAYDQIRVRP
jgi:L-malate glycosyltransferase